MMINEVRSLPLVSIRTHRQAVPSKSPTPSDSRDIIHCQPSWDNKRHSEGSHDASPWCRRCRLGSLSDLRGIGARGEGSTGLAARRNVRAATSTEPTPHSRRFVPNCSFIRERRRIERIATTYAYPVTARKSAVREGPSKRETALLGIGRPSTCAWEKKRICVGFCSSRKADPWAKHHDLMQRIIQKPPTCDVS